MVGNDIIDLKLAAENKSWRRARFLDKVFTNKEQHYILNDSDTFEKIWLLWSLKESAYKIYMQQGGTREFAPKKFEADCFDTLKSNVLYEGEVYQGISKITKEYIYSVVFSENQNYYSDCFTIAPTSAKAQSENTYLVLKKRAAERYGLDFNSLEIIKTATGIPKIYYKKELLNISFSLTHHGNFGAIAFA